MSPLYERIKTLRLGMKMSQSELAKKIGYNSRSMIARIEAGDVDLSQSKIVQFAEALETTPAFLMGWSNDSKNYGIYPLKRESPPPNEGSGPMPPAEYAMLKTEDREFVDQMIRKLANHESERQ